MQLKPPFRIQPPDLAIAAGLSLMVLAVFLQASSFQFLTWDDPSYVTDNTQVRQGLSLHGIAWAFTTFQAANWHPLTWLSHMVDVSLFGLAPRGHHATSIGFHAANVVLLYSFLLRATGARWRSALVAALFAIHPLHVESVAWVAERKDVLSTFFWLLTMHFYIGYARKPGLLRYLAVAASLGLGLLAKPMLVTLPFVLLLLDIWPLRRLSLNPEASAERRKVLRRLVVEKLPLGALVIVSLALTFVAQSRGQAVVMIELIPLPDRAANAVISYAAYLLQAFYPAGLSFFYPFRENWGSGALLMSIALLAAITAWAWRERAAKPVLLVGWLWYLGTLVPVIGLVQVGIQAMADRYTYVPLTGIFVAIAWSIPDPGTSSLRRNVTVSAALITLAVLVAVAHDYAGKWRSSKDLYLHALSVAPDNYRAHEKLAVEYVKEGKLDQARHHILESLRLAESSRLASTPQNLSVYHITLGNIENMQGNLEQAYKQYSRALELYPDDAIARLNQGMVLKKTGQHDRAIQAFEDALRLNPGHAGAHNNLGFSLLMTGQTDRAVDHYRQALALRPDYVEASFNLAVGLEMQGRLEEAVAQYRRTLEMNPDSIVNHLRLAKLLIVLGRRQEAARNVAEALRLSPDNPAALDMQKGLTGP
jgi:tetratricopeptide (TPR) repeat protein